MTKFRRRLPVDDRAILRQDLPELELNSEVTMKMFFLRYESVCAGVLIVLCSFIGYCSESIRVENQDRAWSRGYEMLKSAELKERVIDPAMTLSIIREARKIFLDLHKNYPLWNPELVQFQLDVCDRKIETLERIPADKPPDASNPVRVEDISTLRGKLVAAQITINALETNNEKLSKIIGEYHASPSLSQLKLLNEELTIANTALGARIRLLEEQISTMWQTTSTATLSPDLSASLIVDQRGTPDEYAFERIRYEKEKHLRMIEIVDLRKRNRQLTLDRESAVARLKRQSNLAEKLQSRMRADKKRAESLRDEFDSLASHFTEKQKRVSELESDVTRLRGLVESSQEPHYVENNLNSSDMEIIVDSTETPEDSSGQRNLGYRNEIESKVVEIANLRESLRLEEINARDYSRMHQRAERDLAVLQKTNHHLRESIKLLNLRFEAHSEDDRKIKSEITELKNTQRELAKREQRCLEKYSGQLALSRELAKELAVLKNSE